MKKSCFFDFISKHIGWIVIITTICVFFAPSFISQSYSEWWTNCPIFGNIDFSNTGQIGDTIGGVTAPFIGLLSIILLYITFRAQAHFNKSQQYSNDIGAIWKMVADISKNIQDFNVKLSNDAIIDSLEDINNLTNIKLGKREFLNIYYKVSAITNLCLLAYNFNDESSIPKETKRTFRKTLWFQSLNVAKFWTLCSEKKIEVSGNCDLIGIKMGEINSYIEKLQNQCENYKINNV